MEHVSLLALNGRQLVACRFGPYQRTRRGCLRGQADLILRDGAFYLYATLEVPDVPTPEVDDFLGVDLGIVNIATDSDATVYIIVFQEERRVIRHYRAENNAWFVALHGANSTVPFPCPEVELTLAEIYQRLD